MAGLPVSLEPLCPLHAEEWPVKREDGQGQMGSQGHGTQGRVPSAVGRLSGSA